MGQGKLRGLLLVAVTLIWPAAAQGAAATVRGFDAAPGLAYRLQVDGKTKASLSSLGAFTGAFSVSAKRHVFRAIGPDGHTIARARLRIAAGRRAVVSLAPGLHGYSLILAHEPIARPGVASFRVVNLASAVGATDITLGDSTLHVIKGLQFGHTSRTITISPGAARLGHFDLQAIRVADRSGRGDADLLVATGNALLYVLMPTASATTLKQLPWTATGPGPVTPPAITGIRRYRNSLTCSGGTWTGNPDIRRVWTLDGKTVAGSTNSTLPLTQGQHDGHAIGCRVTATLGGHSVTIQVAPFWLPKAPAPAGQPTITGTPVAGQTLTCGQGAWLWNPTGFTYVWFRDGVQINTTATHLLSVADNLKALTCTVTATNDGGEASQDSLEAVTLGAPVPTTAPTIGGTVAIGQQLSRTAPGTWTYPVSVTLAYEWLRCTAAGTGCSDIAGQTGTTYTITSADIGHTLVLQETASDPADATLAQSQQSAATTAVPASLAIQASTAITRTTVSLHALVTANGVATTVHFALTCTTPCVGKTMPDHALGAGAPDPVSVDDAVTGLDPNTAYGVRLIETSPASRTVTTGGDFTTLPNAPVTSLDATTGIGQTAATLHGHIDTSGVQATAHFEYSTDPGFAGAVAVADHTNLGPGSAVAVSDALTGLSPNTTYYVRLQASSTGGGADPTPATSSFTTLALAPAPTVDATDTITRTTATVNGHVDTNGVSATAHFAYWPDTNTSDITSTAPQSVPAGSSQAVSADISGLTANTAYTVELIVTNNGGTGQDTGGGFTTLPDPPVVTVTATTAIAQTTATVNGHIDPNGVTATGVHFEYTTDATFTTFTVKTLANVPVAGDVTADLTGLDPNSLYHVRLVAQNTGGSTTSSEGTFTTLPDPPTIGATPLDDITTSGVTLRGTVNPNGDATGYSFAEAVDGASLSPVGSGSAGSGKVAAPVSTPLSGLVASTIYDYQLSATNSGGPSQGAVLKFRSAADLAALSTVTITWPATPTPGDVLTCNRGTWTDDANDAFGYVWIRDGSAILGETASTYTLASADLGHTINCVVTATNTYGGIVGGSTSHSSSNGQLIMSPINTAAPVATPGATSATVDPGTWIGSGTITYTFVWSVCPDNTGGGCGSAPGSTDGTTGEYTYDASDVSGTFLKVTVTATDTVGQKAVDSNVIQVP